MFKMLMYSYFMMVVFMINMILAMWFYFIKVDLIIEWMVYGFNSSMLEVYILIDWISCLFMGFVLIISSMVMIYSIEYMGKDKMLNRFVFLVSMFILSMLLMILSPSLISILLGWDMLGLVSYCLVIYYHNLSSYNSGMVTVLINRLGDVGLLMAIGLMLMAGSWNIYLLSKSSSILVFMILVAAVTKSAQMPFSTWLPMAMAAPTPVSSLVHSSTLVTAGVYLIIRFSDLINGGGIGGTVLVFSSVLTMFMSGLMANFEFDLKKIIALSTLSQLGLMMMTLGVGLSLLSFFHLLVHAIFKSLLFLCAGSLIHLMKDNQDIRCCGALASGVPFVFMSLNISILSLMGFPFLSGFYSKDLIMEVLYSLEINLFMFLFIVISLSLTVMYSLRLCYYLNFFKVKLLPSFISLSESNLMNFSMIFLMLSSISGGVIISWMFFFEFDLVFLPTLIKLMTITLVILGAITGGIWVGGSFKYLVIFKWLVYYNSFMWMMNFINMSLSKFFLVFSDKSSTFDYLWVEFGVVDSWLSFKGLVEKTYFSSINLYNIVLNLMFLMGMVLLLVYI